MCIKIINKIIKRLTIKVEASTRKVGGPEISTKQAAVTGQLSKFNRINLDKPTEHK